MAGFEHRVVDGEAVRDIFGPHGHKWPAVFSLSVKKNPHTVICSAEQLTKKCLGSFSSLNSGCAVRIVPWRSHLWRIISPCPAPHAHYCVEGTALKGKVKGVPVVDRKYSCGAFRSLECKTGEGCIDLVQFVQLTGCATVTSAHSHCQMMDDG